MTIRRLLAAWLLGLGLLVPTAAAAQDVTAQPVSLTAVVVPGAKPLTNAAFTITSLDPNGQAETVVRSAGGPALAKLPAGHYRVEAAYDLSRKAIEITVGNRPSAHEINLDAGTVSLKLRHHVGGEIFRDGVRWEILTFGKDGNGERKLIGAVERSQPTLVLSKGYYIARAVRNTQIQEHTIEVGPGKTFNYIVILQ